MHRKYPILALALVVLATACSPQATPRNTEAPTLEVDASPTADIPAGVKIVGNTPEPGLTEQPTQAVGPGMDPSPTVPANPTAIPTAPPPFWGIHIGSLRSEREIELAQAADARWTRFDRLNWDLIEPQNTTPDNYRWNTVDERGLLNAASAGLAPIAIVLFTPSWAQKYPGIACGPIAESALDEFGEFMEAAVARYSQPPYNVKYWEIGNEPDISYELVGNRSGFGCWGEQGDEYYGARAYADMLKVVYPRIKEADPEARVVIGGLLLDCDPINPPEISPGSGEYKNCAPARFLEGILEYGGGDYFDAVSFHAYDYYYGEIGAYGNSNWHSAWDGSGPVLSAKTRYLRALLASYNQSDKELLNSEVALLCGRDGQEPFCRTEEFENTKAYYAAQVNAAALAEGLRANIWYHLTGWRGSGLVNRGLRAYRVYEAYRFSVEQLNGAAYRGRVDAFEGLNGYKFLKDDQEMWFIWSRDGEEHTVELPTRPGAVYDVYGEPIALKEDGSSVTVGIAPVYMIWEQ